MSESNRRRGRRDANTLRTFICIEIPEQIKARIETLQSALRSADVQASWVKVAKIHLTLRFLGDVPLSQIADVCEATKRAAASINPFEIEAGGAGCFPSPRNPRALWIGLTRIPEELTRLHKNLESELAREGFPREQKKFSPHLTIARIRSPRNADSLAKDLIARGFEAECFLAEEIIVMSSDLKPTGAVYTPQAVMKFDKQDL